MRTLESRLTSIKIPSIFKRNKNFKSYSLQYWTILNKLSNTKSMSYFDQKSILRSTSINIIEVNNSTGITTVLTLSTISLDSRTDLPKVHYATALDWFILMSFAYCMATLLQCAGVHYFTKVLIATYKILIKHQFNHCKMY